MHVCYTACCGLDVHKKRVVAYLRTPGANGQRRSEVRTFATTTRALMELADWLVAGACTHVAMLCFTITVTYFPVTPRGPAPCL